MASSFGAPHPRTEPISVGETSDVNRATSVKAKATDPKAKATATCCRSTASARQRTTDESTLTELSSTRNLFNNGEQSLNCYSVMGNHS